MTNVPHNWSNGETITADKLNNMPFIIPITANTSTGEISTEVSFADAYSALTSGRFIIYYSSSIGADNIGQAIAFTPSEFTDSKIGAVPLIAAFSGMTLIHSADGTLRINSSDEGSSPSS